MTTTKHKENNKWSNYSLRVFVNTLSHPFEYAKVLIQVSINIIDVFPKNLAFTYLIFLDWL